MEEIKYLGHPISSNGVAVDSDKISAMLNWPQPTTPRAMRGFLGLAGYYRKFIQNYGRIVSPLTQMLKKDSFQWSPKAIVAFEQL